jgi:hypothetical protein
VFVRLSALRFWALSAGLPWLRWRLPAFGSARVSGELGPRSRRSLVDRRPRDASRSNERQQTWHDLGMQDLRQFFRENPQALVLLIICLVLGLGMFLIVVFALASSGSSQTTGEPSGALHVLQAALNLRPL